MPDRPATLRDVAAAARVHPATASRALNPETRILVSEDTARRVTDAAARLGYRPNPVARSLRTRRSHTVGVLIPDLNNPLFPPIVRGLEDKLAAAGYVALLGNTDADASRERTLFEQMRARHVDGFVLATATLHGQLLADAAAAAADMTVLRTQGVESESPLAFAALQRLLNADPPRAGIYHDGIFGPQTLAATRQFQSRHGLPANGRAGAGTIKVLGQLAPAPRPVPVAATLLTVALTGIVVLGTMTARRRRERGDPDEIVIRSGSSLE